MSLRDKEKFKKDKEEKEKQQLIEKQRLDLIAVKEGIPTFLNQFIEMSEYLRQNNHNNPEKYSLYSIIKLYKINKKIKNNDMLVEHTLEREMYNCINSTEKTFKKNVAEYQSLIKNILEN